MTKVIHHNANVSRSDDKDTFMSSEGPAVLTGLANPAVIDLLGFDSKRGEVLLVMNESRPWDGGDEQLHQLQEKFNAYASFILDGEMTSVHPELAGKKTRIELRCDQMPPEPALGLLQAIHDQLELQEIKVEVVVRTEGSCGEHCGCHS